MEHPGENDDSSGSAPATDATGAVRVIMSRSYRLESMDVSARWRERLTPEEFRPALLEAISRGATAIAEVDFLDESAAPSQLVAPPVDMFAHVAPSDMDRASERILEICAKVAAETSERVDTVLAQTSTTHCRSDEHRHVQVNVDTSGSITELTIDEKWLASATRERLTAAVRAAFEEAYRAADAGLAAMHPRESAARQLLRRLHDPTELSRWLEEGSLR